jgi:holin-like protein
MTKKILVLLQRRLRSSRSLQILAIFGFWAAGQVVVDLTHVPVPGSIIGLFILLSLLLSRKLSVHTVRHGAFWYLGEMLLFFIPALVAVLDHPEFLGWLGIKIFAAIFLGTLIVMVVTAVVIELCFRWSMSGKGGA